MSNQKKKILVVITEDPYSSEKSFNGLRFALTSLVQEHEVKVLLLDNGVLCAKKDQKTTVFPNMGEWVNNINEAGGKIVICGACATTRGFKKEDMFDFVEWGSMDGFVEMATTSDIQMMF
ncbi:MAG: DsrE/DsrF/TusD sulfur relay family protein [Promethearchaeota archaeon]